MFPVRFSRPALNLIGQFVKSAGGFGIEYLRRQAAAFDDLILYINQQFQVFSHQRSLASGEPNSPFSQPIASDLSGSAGTWAS
jgi:hypothetical protein